MINHLNGLFYNQLTTLDCHSLLAMFDSIMHPLEFHHTHLRALSLRANIKPFKMQISQLKNRISN